MPRDIDVDVTQRHRPTEYAIAAIIAVVAGAVVLFLLATAVSLRFLPHQDFGSAMVNAVTLFLIVLAVLVVLGVVVAARIGKHRHILMTQTERGEKLDNRMREAKIALVEQHGQRIDLGVQAAITQGLPFKLTAAGALEMMPRYPSLHMLGDAGHTPEELSLPIGQPKALHIPTFAESMEHGDIGPNQEDMLFCHELILDELTRQAIELKPVRGEMGMLHTQFIAGGSQSGKTTYMSGIIGQAAAMRTLFYIIDPHKNHPDKSIAAKIQAFSRLFILPPASTHDEIENVLAHATAARDALIQGKPTPYQGYHIMVVVDEVPALMAYQKATDKRIKNLYLGLALFMQSIGTQTAKFGMTGLFGSQFVTKDELGEVEIRDACMSQLLLRLHPTQAQAMRILGKSAIQQIPRLDKGHGFLMLSNSFEPMRVAAGNVTQEDLALLASQLSSAPVAKNNMPAVPESMKYLPPHLDGDMRKVYMACMRLQQAGERISSRRVEALTHINRDKANVLIGKLAGKGLIVRRSTD